MIIYNPVTRRFEITGGGRNFAGITRQVAEQYAKWLAALPNFSSPQDLIASRSTAGMDLCHHLSYSDIEIMVLAYLNGAISINQFVILVGSVTRPSWSNLLFPPTLLLLVFQWAMGMAHRIQVIGNQYAGRPHQAAQAANNLVDALNNAITNLRYGHRTTNRSVHGDRDLRLQRGPTVDPVMIVNILVGWTTGRPVYAAESSALLNDWEAIARGQAPRLPGGGVKMSESNTVVARTQRTNRPVMGVPVEPVQDIFTRGSVRFWLPVSFDSLLYLLGVYCVAYVFGWL